MGKRVDRPILRASGQTPWGRIISGLLLAQGLYYGLRHLCTAALVAKLGEENANNWWNELNGIVAAQGLQALGLIAGGMVAGAGQRRGVMFGGLVGIWNGLLTLLVDAWFQGRLSGVVAYGQPVLHMIFGALGAIIGGLLWRPVPVLAMPPPAPVTGLAVPPRKRKPSPFAGPVAMWRVLGGVAIAVGGTMWAHLIFSLIIEASEGHLQIETQLQERFITWEICFLAMLGGGILAGATTPNGMKQGLLVGLCSGAVLSGLRMWVKSDNPAELFPLHLFGIVPAKNPPILQVFVFSMVTALIAGVVGGWFGGQLLPPLFGPPRRTRYGPGSIT